MNEEKLKHTFALTGTIITFFALLVVVGLLMAAAIWHLAEWLF